MARIAIIDDNFTNARLLSMLLRCAGHVTVCIAEGTKAIDLLRSMKPDLLVLDVEMPGMDGFDVLEQLRKDKGLKSLPVIMFSGLSGQEIRAKAKRMGAQDYVVKGSDSLTLLERIDQCLPGSRAQATIPFNAAVAQ